MKYKIFCDESNHLNFKDNPTLKSNVMVLGAIRVEEEQVEQINKHIKWEKFLTSSKLLPSKAML